MVQRPGYEKEAFELWQEVMKKQWELTKEVPYENIVNTEFAKKSHGEAKIKSFWRL